MHFCIRNNWCKKYFSKLSWNKKKSPKGSPIISKSKSKRLSIIKVKIQSILHGTLKMTKLIWSLFDNSDFHWSSSSWFDIKKSKCPFVNLLVSKEHSLQHKSGEDNPNRWGIVKICVLVFKRSSLRIKLHVQHKKSISIYLELPKSCAC